jgi:hypothetical protein
LKASCQQCQQGLLLRGLVLLVMMLRLSWLMWTSALKIHCPAACLHQRAALEVAVWNVLGKEASSVLSQQWQSQV